LRAKLAITLAAVLGFGSIAADAMAASLAATVTPATVHPGGRFRITIIGRYDELAHPRATYLLAFIQYTGRPCKATATGEYALPPSEWNWDFYPQRAEPKSPFKSVAYWKAGSGLGSRRVCAYLYAEPASPTSKATPLVRAGASYRNVKR
jgi:hypothetical protein